jgi:hypothetical protein
LSRLKIEKKIFIEIKKKKIREDESKKSTLVALTNSPPTDLE